MSLFETSKANCKPSRMPVGNPHFKGTYDQERQGDYNLEKSLCEFVDNAITMCDTIKIKIKTKDYKIQNISISDNADGFVNMFEEGTSNPFNMTHMRKGQKDDEETSQFGKGLKAGAIAAGDKMCVYTKVDDKYWLVEFNFPEMCERVEDSFAPDGPFEITYAQYRSKHPFDKGSTIELSSIREEIYTTTTQEELDTHLIKELSETYNDIIKKGLNIFINDKQIHEVEDIYESKECKPFTNIGTVYHYKAKKYYYITINSNYFWYDSKSKKVIKLIKGKDQELKKMINDDTTEKIATIKSTITCFKLTDTDIKPMGHTGIYRNGRRYGNWEKDGSKLDGNKTYNTSRVDISSKELAKKLGLTFNKNISENITNTETIVFHAFIHLLYKGLNANKSTKDYAKLYEIARRHDLNVIDKEPTFTVKQKNDKSNDSDTESVDSTKSNTPSVKHSNKKSSIVVKISEKSKVKLPETSNTITQSDELSNTIESPLENTITQSDELSNTIESPLENTITRSDELSNIINESVKVEIPLIDEIVNEEIVQNEKKMIKVHPHVKGKVPDGGWKEMIEFYTQHENTLIENKFGIEAFNLYLKAQSELNL
jgi:hypothetical protein